MKSTAFISIFQTLFSEKTSKKGLFHGVQGNVVSLPLTDERKYFNWRKFHPAYNLGHIWIPYFKDHLSKIMLDLPFTSSQRVKAKNLCIL